VRVSTSISVLRRDKRFTCLIKKHGLPNWTKRKNSFQSLVRSIVYQQVSGKAASTILARFAAIFPGTRFPTPKEVGAMPIENIMAAGLSPQKASYVKDLALKFSNGTIQPRSLYKMTNEEVVVHLTQVKGIGTWTAHMFLISTLNRPDVLPTGDLGIRKGFQIVYRLKSLPEHAKMESIAKPWRAYASVASWYLWRAADEASSRGGPSFGKKKRV
jgi:DNA-3-methyladenine glycosylase II